MAKMVDPEKVVDYMLETFRGIFDPKSKIEMEVKVSSGEPGVIYSIVGRHPWEIDKTTERNGFLNTPIESEDILKLLKGFRDKYLGIEEF